MTVLLRQIHNNLICACVLIILFLIFRLGLEGERGGGNNGADLYVLHLCTKFSDE